MIRSSWPWEGFVAREKETLRRSVRTAEPISSERSLEVIEWEANNGWAGPRSCRPHTWDGQKSYENCHKWPGLTRFYHTVLVETEAIVNSRILTPVSDDLNDYEALTTNHFLIGRASPNSPPGRFEEREISRRKKNLKNGEWRERPWLHLVTGVP